LRLPARAPLSPTLNGLGTTSSGTTRRVATSPRSRA